MCLAFAGNLKTGFVSSRSIYPLEIYVRLKMEIENGLFSSIRQILRAKMSFKKFKMAAILNFLKNIFARTICLLEPKLSGRHYGIMSIWRLRIDQMPKF